MNELKIGRMVCGGLQTNVYFVYREEDRKAIVIDPAAEGTRIYASLFKNDIKVEAILLTHGHFDHIMGVSALKGAVNRERVEKGLEPIKVYALDKEREILTDPTKNLSTWEGDGYTMEADEYLRDGQELTFAGMTCKVLATPGHTVGGCCYYFEEGNILVSGDTLFCESTGRTDFPTGSMGTLVRSIQETLFRLPNDTRVYPGHGPSTNIGYEKENNPFVALN